MSNLFYSAQYSSAYMSAAASGCVVTVSAGRGTGRTGPDWSLLHEVDFAGALPDWSDPARSHNQDRCSPALDLERALAYAG